jgi:RNA polymerase sigma-70 factor (ECF subfamily)
MDAITSAALRAAQGDEASLVAFVQATQAATWRFCAHQVDRAAADDLTQETYLRALRALGGFRAESSAQTWLLGVARHVCLDELRRRGRGRAVVERVGAGLGRAASYGYPSGGDASGVVVLDELIAALPDDRREAFVLTQVVGLTYAETAEVCGCELGTIRSRVARARATLVDALVDGGAEADRGQA